MTGVQGFCLVDKWRNEFSNSCRFLKRPKCHLCRSSSEGVQFSAPQGGRVSRLPHMDRHFPALRVPPLGWRQKLSKSFILSKAAANLNHLKKNLNQPILGAFDWCKVLKEQSKKDRKWFKFIWQFSLYMRQSLGMGGLP